MHDRFYAYKGAITELEKPFQHVDDIVIWVEEDTWGNPPVRLTAIDEMGAYLTARSWTDAEERYFNATWYFDRRLHLRWVEIPAVGSDIPAKVIAVDMKSNFGEGYGKVAVFGPEDYIATDQPERMDAGEFEAWLRWKREYL